MVKDVRGHLQRNGQGEHDMEVTGFSARWCGYKVDYVGAIPTQKFRI